MKRKFDAVYFSSMNYTSENVDLIKEHFNVKILSNIKNLSPNKNNTLYNKNKALPPSPSLQDWALSPRDKKTGPYLPLHTLRASGCYTCVSPREI